MTTSIIYRHVARRERVDERNVRGPSESTSSIIRPLSYMNYCIGKDNTSISKRNRLGEL